MKLHLHFADNSRHSQSPPLVESQIEQMQLLPGCSKTAGGQGGQQWVDSVLTSVLSKNQSNFKLYMRLQ